MADAPPTADPPSDEPARARRRRRLRRAAIALGVFLLVLGGSWHALFFWASSTGRLERWLGGRPERFQIRWSEIRSPLPFVFEAEGLVLDVRTRRLRWELTADRARLFVDPLALLDRRLILRDARASGAAFRLAHEPEPELPGEPATAAPGDDQPARARGEHRPRIDVFPGGSAPLPTATRKPWSWVVAELELEQLREIWLDDLKLNGTVSGRLGFALNRREWAELYPSRLRIETTKVALAGSQLTDRLDGELDLQVLPWRYQGAGAEDLLARLQGTVALRGEAALGPVFRYLFGDRPWLVIGADVGVLETSLSIDRGRLRSGSRLSASLAEAPLEAFGFSVRGKAALAAQVTGARDQELLESRLELDGWTLARPGEAALFRGDGLVVDAELAAPRADRIPSAGKLEVDLGRGRAEDLRFVNELLPGAAGIAVERGALELTGKLRFAGAGPSGVGDRSGSGELALAGERLAIVARGQRLAADLAVDLRLSEPDFAAGSFALDGSKLALRKVSAATSAGAKIEEWWGETELVSGRVTLRQPFASAGEFRSRVADTRPLIAFYELRRDLPKWAEGALLVEDVRLSGRYRASVGRLEMTDLHIPFANGEARAELDLQRGRRQARLLLSWRKLDLGIELDGTRRVLHLRHAREWFEQGSGRLR